jgi:hypothetical protein
MVRDSDRSGESHISTDREQIRSWADAHGVRPVQHRDEAEQYRLLEDADVTESHRRADWDDFHSHLEENDNVVVYHGEGASEPFEVTHRDDAFTRSDVDREDLESRLIEGETVTTTVTETETIERVVHEEATIESELVDTEIVDSRVVDAELLGRDVTNCTITAKGDVDDRDWFDDEYYLSRSSRSDWDRAGTTTDVGESTTEATTTTDLGDDDRDEGEMLDDEEYPYYAEMEVEERWNVTREFTERFTVESRVTDVDVDETDTVADHDIDVEGLQRNIVESDLLDLDRSEDEVMRDYEIDSDFHEDDTIRTHFSRTRTVEDEVVDRRRLHSDITSGERQSFERTETRDVSPGTRDEDVATTATSDTDTYDDSESHFDDTATASEGDAVTLGNDEVGKKVVDATGEKIGLVTEVDDSGQVMYVDADPSITERIRAALDWSHANEDDYPVEAHQIASIGRDEVKLRETEDIDTHDKTD